MINLRVSYNDEAGPLLLRIITGLQNRKPLHAKIAADGEAYLKKTGREKAQSQHRSAQILGAAPTRHLEKAYQAIEGEGTDTAALLRIPRASRLRAAFGAYVLRPGNGKKYLTIPVAKEAYGRRAGEFPDLQFMRVGPRKTPILARATPDGEGIETMYVLAKSATIQAAPELIRFDLLTEHARDSAQEYIDGLRNGGPA